MPSVNLGRVSIVPKGAWSNSNSYEKLDVVTYGGGSYIANKDVPAGTSLSTTEYWSNFVGSFNIGTVETVSASTGASAELITTSTGQTLNLQIPRGVAGNESIDDSKGNGDTDYVWSADKSWNEVNNLDIDINGKANAIEKTVSGDIVSFDDGADNQYVKSLKVNIEPIQDLHGYDHPWPAGGGKNLHKPYSFTTTAADVTFTYNSDGSVVINGTATASNGTPTVAYASSQGFTYTLPAGTYIPSISGSTTNVLYEVYDVSSVTQLSSGASFTISEAKTVLFRVGVQNGKQYNNQKIYMQIESGSTATTYAPYSNICPISGWTEANVTRTGINIWDEQWDNGSINQNTGENANGTYVRSKNLIPVPDNTNVYLKCGAGNYTVWIYAYDKNGQFVKTAFSNYGYKTTTFNLAAGLNIPSGIGYIRFLVDKTSYGTTYNHDISINYPTTDTQYHAGHVQTVTIDLNGTRYGGQLDVTNGKMVVDKAMVDFGTLNWTYTDVNKWFYNYSIGIKSNTTNAICSNYPYATVATITGDLTVDKKFTVNNTSLCIRDLAYTDAATFKTAMSGVQLVYELATPITITLTPQQLSTFLGENYIWADSGDIEVTYPVETKDYIDNIIDDTAGTSATTKVWSANKVATTLAEYPYIKDKLTTLIGISNGNIQDQIYLEEGNASGSSLYYKGGLRFFRYNKDTVKSYNTIISELGVTTVTSPKGVENCIEIPNNNALVFDCSDETMKFILRTKLLPSHLPIFFNAYGRAENPHQTINEVKIFQHEYRIAAAETNIQNIESSLSDLVVADNNLESKFGNKIFGIFNNVKALGNWRVGGLTGVTINNIKYRICTSEPIILSENIPVIIESGRRLSVHYMKEDGTLDEDTGWLTNSYTLEKDRKFLAVISGTSSTSLEESSIVADVDTFANYVYFESYVSKNKPYVSVKMFGAKGDGVTDDTQSIQNAIDVAHTLGKDVFIPTGTYILSTNLFSPSVSGISHSLEVYSNQKIFGESGTVLKKGNNTANHLLFTHNESSATGYTGAENIVIESITFDSDRSNYSSANTPLNISHANNVKIKNCIFRNSSGGWHSIEINSSRYVEVDGCKFLNNANAEDIQLDAAIGQGNLGQSDNTVCKDIDIHNCYFSSEGSAPSIGNHSNAEHTNVRIHENVFASASSSSRGIIDMVSSTKNLDIYNNTFYASTYGIVLNNTTQNSTIHDNRFESVTNPYTGGAYFYDNIVDGAFSR